MIIGLDFDNTIVDYNDVFHKVALEKNYIDKSLPRTKLAVRDDLRARNMEELWTELQGHVYGSCMDQADVFPGVIGTLRWAHDNGAKVAIISHKTRFPVLGPRYDLHASAHEWIKNFLLDVHGNLVESDNINFCETRVEKIERIAEIDCDVFIDDLLEVLQTRSFPKTVQRFLFDPVGQYEAIHQIQTVTNWHQFLSHLKS